MCFFIGKKHLTGNTFKRIKSVPHPLHWFTSATQTQQKIESRKKLPKLGGGDAKTFLDMG